jgi:hypothetical protein
MNCCSLVSLFVFVKISLLVLCHFSVLCSRCFVVSFVVSCLSSLFLIDGFGLTVGLRSWILCCRIVL